MIPPAPLSDGVVTLRAPEERDLAAIERGLLDADVIAAFGRATDTARGLLQLNRDRWQRGDAATFAICDDADRCVGHVFINLGADRRGTIGYWLLPEARGRGHATRAVRLVSRWAYEEVDVARLGLLAAVSNRPSQRVAELAGFVREGVLRSYAEIDGRREDEVCYSLLRDEVT
jgi:RimJ/RimL family protein N-acetyltransferase